MTERGGKRWKLGKGRNKRQAKFRHREQSPGVPTQAVTEFVKSG